MYARSIAKKKVIEYFSKRGSRWGYSLLLRGAKHFGYYPEGGENISMAEAQDLMIEKLYEKLDLKPRSLLLDAGCGEGGVAIYLATKYQLQARGVDLLDFSIEKANKRRADFGLKEMVVFQVMDYENLDFPDAYFDGVYTMETLVHAENYHKALQEFYRVIKPGGKLVLFEYSVCSQENLPLKLQEMRNMIIQESGMYSLPYFLHGKFPELLENVGFSNVTVENITSRVMPMLKRLYQIAYVPHKIITLFGLQRKFVNAVSAVEVYKQLMQGDVGRYNIISAMKSG